MYRIAGAIIVAVYIASCTAPREPLTVHHPDPSIKIPAIKIAVARRDLSAARQLVKDLESDDAAVRFYAISGLRRLTGESFGYLYYEDPEQREPALKQWQAWLAQVEQSAAQDRGAEDGAEDGAEEAASQR